MVENTHHPDLLATHTHRLDLTVPINYASNTNNLQTNTYLYSFPSRLPIPPLSALLRYSPSLPLPPPPVSSPSHSLILDRHSVQPSGFLSDILFILASFNRGESMAQCRTTNLENQRAAVGLHGFYPITSARLGGLSRGRTSRVF